MKERFYIQQQHKPKQKITQDSDIGCTTKSLYGNMPCWYYDKKELKETPSILDGISFETERRYRKEGARFIMSCGTEMGLGHNTVATGVVYFHRFYMFHSFKSFPRYVTACCCLLLAGKVEETPKKCRDIIKTARARLTDTQFYSFGDDPKEEVMTLERILLQTIKFDLQVEHPYTFLLKYAKCFKGDQQKLQKMVQMAWNFVNDSLSTVVCLQWEPEIIAVALIHLASKLSKFTVADWIGRQQHHLRWWDMFVADVTMDILEDICHQVLDLYQTQHQQPTESHSPPQKPPSRADSPTPLKSNTAAGVLPAASPPSAKIKPVASVSNVVVPPIINAPPQPELNNIQAIKSLGTAPTNVPSAPETLLSTSGGIVPTSAAVAAAAAAYPMYPPTHQVQSMYNSAPAPPHLTAYGGAVTGATPTTVLSTAAAAVVVPPPLPPPPPMTAYGGGTGWPGTTVPSSHYGNNNVPVGGGIAGGNATQLAGAGRVPPPLLPGPGSNYYQQQQPNYGRQSRY